MPEAMDATNRRQAFGEHVEQSGRKKWLKACNVNTRKKIVLSLSVVTGHFPLSGIGVTP
jgi:hypothetical protein